MVRCHSFQNLLSQHLLISSQFLKKSLLFTSQLDICSSEAIFLMMSKIALFSRQPKKQLSRGSVEFLGSVVLPKIKQEEFFTSRRKKLQRLKIATGNLGGEIAATHFNFFQFVIKNTTIVSKILKMKNLKTICRTKNDFKIQKQDLFSSWIRHKGFFY